MVGKEVGPSQRSWKGYSNGNAKHGVKKNESSIILVNYIRSI